MIRYVNILILILAYISPIYAFSIDIDSTEDSEILFTKLEAVASSRIVHFKWEVEKESKGATFIIEKSIDKIIWKQIQSIRSIGDHKERHTYQISEINFAEGVHEYFRITRIDVNGVHSVLDVITLDQPILSNLILLPDPKKTKDILVISYDSLISSKGLLYVKSADGEIVDERYLFFDEGYNRLMINYKKYDSGIYQIVLKDEFDNRLVKSFRVN